MFFSNLVSSVILESKLDTNSEYIYEAKENQ